MADADKIIALARSQVGYREGFSGGHWNNYQKFSPQVPGLEWSQNMAWCDTFVAWLFVKSGLGAQLPVKSASCLQSVAGFKKAGRFSEYPAIGAQIFFGPGGGTHTGIVTGYDSTYVYTIEGNTNDGGSPEGNGVYTKKYFRTASRVYGYGYPLFKEGIVSADPKWAKQKPKKVSAPVKAVVKKKPWVWGPNCAPGKKGNSARIIQRALSKELGIEVPVSEYFTKATVEAYQEFQKKLGYKGKDADGIPGLASLRYLANKHGFDIVGTVGKGEPDGSPREVASYWVTRALQHKGLPSTWHEPMMTLIERESNFNPRAINGWDVNAKNGDPSRGYCQVIMATFVWCRDKSLPNDIYDPLANIVAAINWIIFRYGTISKVQQANKNLPPKGY